MAKNEILDLIEKDYLQVKQMLANMNGVIWPMSFPN